ncbi:hypothetical protein FC60_GL001809 [Limosilactobacillus gastricus DSM 16045]|uniref:Uncharacterized protein n=1 Tax=Limosilactobacillus gastricus DSM 16045 TaxID=1423749 RepID=A0A0R1VHD9_9LACO|nr:hypothetical protein [Limosilactobacillus gastricus]KRM02633.1 hypothetical protein FC60_GL001809 [Limosilactobacillus gastricus DSM 16045]
MISNEHRAHDLAVAIMQAKYSEKLSPIEAYHEYVNVLLPILREIDKDFPDGIKEHV